MEEITRLLHRARSGERTAEDLLLERIYTELHQLAVHFLSGERADHTLQPSALVNEAYLKLFGKKVTDWENRAHFYVSAARTMRRILIDYARTRSAAKRPCRQHRVEMKNALALVRERSAEFIALDEALDKLAEWDSRQAQIVNLRSSATTATVMSNCAKRHWRCSATAKNRERCSTSAS